ncbi:uncharacterized protein LOC114363762 [Ostrinia furnacalis]|uniref:uncharacterized protein LOC114363762 n=1 Tax=Ostrinia furnacalis TaxID=93504 RepID=UPI00103BC8FF|nr:uncharacterized protein LOC114363762 [Ostrinia furnacalis]
MSQDQCGDGKHDDSDDDDKADGEPTTSKLDTLHPEQTSHNMNDLKTLDFNSADEIRQTMKAVFASKGPHEDPDHTTCLKANVGIETNSVKRAQGSTQSPSINQARQRTVQIEAKENLFQRINPKNEKGNSNIRKKRPGRPPKAGTSKKIKRASVSALYVGKLSNVVPFKRCRYASESESDDLDSLVIMY